MFSCRYTIPKPSSRCTHAYVSSPTLHRTIYLKFYAADSLHLEEELELEAAEERQFRLPPETWGLDDLKHSLLLVSDDVWFQEGEGMIDLKVLGPSRPNTFRRVLSGVPGAIYGCLKVRRWRKYIGVDDNDICWKLGCSLSAYSWSTATRGFLNRDCR